MIFALRCWSNESKRPKSKPISDQKSLSTFRAWDSKKPHFTSSGCLDNLNALNICGDGPLSSNYNRLKINAMFWCVASLKAAPAQALALEKCQKLIQKCRDHQVYLKTLNLDLSTYVSPTVARRVSNIWFSDNTNVQKTATISILIRCKLLKYAK